MGGDSDLQRIDPDRPFDVLELRLAEIRDRHIEPAAHLTVGVLGKTDRARPGDPFQSRGDIDAVAHQIAVALLDDVAQMNADAKFYALVGRDARIALDHGVLHFERAAHRVDYAAELDDAAVAGALDDAAMMHGDCGINQIAAKGSEPSEDAIFVRPGEPAVADDVGHQDRRELPSFGHCSLRMPAVYHQSRRVAARSPHSCAWANGNFWGDLRTRKLVGVGPSSTAVLAQPRHYRTILERPLSARNGNSN